MATRTRKTDEQTASEDRFETMAAAWRRTAEVTRQNLATASALTEAMSAGFEAYGTVLARAANAAAARRVAFADRALAAATPRELATLQVDAMTAGLDALAAHSTELNRIAVETFARCAGPVRTRFDEAMAAFDPVSAA